MRYEKGTIERWSLLARSVYYWWSVDQDRIKRGMLPAWKSSAIKYIEDIEFKNLTDKEIIRMGKGDIQWTMKYPIE